MTDTFTHTDSDDDSLTVRAADNADHAAYVLTSPGGVYVRATEAPAVALAILTDAKAADTDPSGSVATAIARLARVIAMREQEAKRAAEAAKAEADRSALFQEAKALQTAYMAPYTPADVSTDDWLNVARTARKLYAKKETDSE